MKVFLLLFVCVALVSYGAQGEEADKKDDVEENEEEGRRQFISPYVGGLSAAQAAAAANAQGFRPTPPRPTPPRPTPPSDRGCYSCVDCPDTSKLTSQHLCTAYNQRCVSFVEKYKHGKKQLLYVRGCVSERGNCEDIRRAHKDRPDVKLVSCEECDGDRCNSNGVARSLPDLTAALFFVVFTPLITKYALS
ncbi:uncharacterized protein LOC114353833 [Ostrinia furnacalis]|uniref:uncharacterized protein LOC114353833 n=1 Tax=Ostrinia furnacalis TaxID=93504 RepID=UPI00103C2110|nr:uncharacterized protein LOC114353833 [Ostrinia furnacalis]